MSAKWLVMEGLAATADQTRVDVVGDEGDHPGPVELTTDVLNHLGDARVSSQPMVVVGVKDVQSNVLIVGDIEQSLIAKSPSCESDQGSGGAIAEMVVVKSGPTCRHVR